MGVYLEGMNKQNVTTTYLTTLELVTNDFKVQVLQNKNAVITGKTKLDDFVTDRRFEKDFKEIWIDRTRNFFGESITRLYDKPVVEILEHLKNAKLNKVKWGRK